MTRFGEWTRADSEVPHVAAAPFEMTRWSEPRWRELRRVALRRVAQLTNKNTRAGEAMDRFTGPGSKEETVALPPRPCEAGPGDVTDRQPFGRADSYTASAVMSSSPSSARLAR